MSNPPTTAVVLCGGRGERLGGVDKPLVELAGKTLLARLIERLEPQVEAVVLSGVREPRDYDAFGYPLVEDKDRDQGPLAGIVSARSVVRTPWILTTPVDTPFLPLNLVARLAPACQRTGAAVVTAGGHRQNLAMLLAPERVESLVRFYASGGRAVHRWLAAYGVEEVELPAAGFFNINTPDDLARADELLPTLERAVATRQGSSVP